MAGTGSSVDVAKAIADPLATLGALLKALTPGHWFSFTTMAKL
jgi:hypothetical protein